LTFVILTKLSPDALTKPDAVTTLNKQVEERIKKELLHVKWLAHYAVLGPCDYLEIFEALDTGTATKVALLLRTVGHGTTETWVVTQWDRFTSLATVLKS
jgi:uncharacterized protein with GYD domain